MKPVKHRGIYQHYRNGKSYIVTELPENPNTGKVVVVYRRCGMIYDTNSQHYWRPYAEFQKKFEEEDI